MPAVASKGKGSAHRHRAGNSNDKRPRPALPGASSNAAMIADLNHASHAARTAGLRTAHKAAPSANLKTDRNNGTHSRNKSLPEVAPLPGTTRHSRAN